MAKLVDAPASGAGACKGVEVRVFFWAPKIDEPHVSNYMGLFLCLIHAQSNIRWDQSRLLTTLTPPQIDQIPASRPNGNLKRLRHKIVTLSTHDARLGELTHLERLADFLWRQ